MRIPCLFLAVASMAAAGPVDELGIWLKLDRNSRPALASQAFARAALTSAESEQARTLLWAERIAFVKAEQGAQWTGKRLVDPENLAMRFDYRIYGTKPAAGYDLYISMHGGGGVPAATNDGQWQNQITLYQPPGIYLAPRAPTDAWNMWHKAHIDGFFDRIIHLASAYLDANPNRVYVMGYSAGGDGAYQMAPRMADRWAAGAMMAGYPNNASPVNLRNIGFTLHVGGEDAAYGRNTIAVTYGKQIQKLQDADPGFYKYDVQVHEGKPHWMDLEDKVALPWMAAFTRNPHPNKVVWLQDTTVGTNSFPSGPMVIVKGVPTQYQFYWVARPDRKALPLQASITAEIKGQEVHIQSTNLDSVTVFLNDKLLDLDKPVAFFWKGAKVQEGILPRTAANLFQTLDSRGDREYAYPVKLTLSKDGPGVSIKEGRRQAAIGFRKVGGKVLIQTGRDLGPVRDRISDLTGRTVRIQAYGARLPP